MACSVVVTSPFVFLKTAIVSVRSHCGNFKANVLLDEGSQRTFIINKLSKLLSIKSTEQERLLLSDFATVSQIPSVYDVVEFTVFDHKNFPTIMKAIIVDELANPLDDKHRDALQSLPPLKNLDLAHPGTGKESFDIEILIRVDFYWSMVENDMPIRGNGPTVVCSRIGYLVPLPSIKVKHPNLALSLHVITLEEDISRIWTFESVGIFPQKESKEEVADCEKRCIEYQEGKYIAKFSWKMDHPEMPSNFKMVQNMTRLIVRRLFRDPSLLKIFDGLLQQQLNSQFIEKVRESQLPNRCHFIPYHYVKKDSSITPIRIVNNCSCRG